MDTVEREYRTRIGRLTGQQRVALSVGLLNELREMTRRRIAATQPELNPRELDLEVAAALYRTDAGVQGLIQMLKDQEA